MSKYVAVFVNIIPFWSVGINWKARARV